MGLNEEGEGKWLALCSAFMYLEASEFKEGTYPIQYTHDGASMQAIHVGNYTIDPVLDVHAGIYPDLVQVGLDTWVGKCHWNVSGSLKIENLSKEK